MGSAKPGLSSSRPHHLTSIHYTLSEIAKCFYQDKKNAFLCLNCFVVIRAADCWLSTIPGVQGRVAQQLYIPPANSHYLLIIIKSN